MISITQLQNISGILLTSEKWEIFVVSDVSPGYGSHKNAIIADCIGRRKESQVGMKEKLDIRETSIIYPKRTRETQATAIKYMNCCE